MAQQCKIDYIEQEPLLTKEDKNKLTQLHLNISKQLYQHRINNKGYVDKLFTYTGERLYVPVGERSQVYFKAAKNLIDQINLDNGYEVVALLQDENNKGRAFVSVNVIPSANREHPVDSIDTMQMFYKNYFGHTQISIDPSEMEQGVPQSEEVFKSIAEDVRAKTNIYLKSLQLNSGDTFINDATKKQLEILSAVLKDQSTYGIIEGLSKYITTANYSLNKINTRINIIENKLNNLESSGELRSQQLTDVANFVRHSTYYYHLFDKLEDINTEFKKLGINQKPIDNYERDLLEADLKNWLESFELFSEQEITEFLNSTPNNINNLFVPFKALYKEKLNGVIPTSDEIDELEKQMLNILNKNMKSEGSTLQQIQNVLNQLPVYKSKLKDLHYDTLVEIYYPVFTASFNEEGESIDGSSLEDKWKLNKEDFKSLLMLAEEDIDSFAMWGSAMINVKETIPVTVANFFKNVVIDIDINNKKDITDFQNFLVSNGRQQGDEVLKALDSNSVMQHLTIDAVEEVDDTFTPSNNQGVITMKVLGVEKRYKARKTKNFLNEFNNVAYNNLKKVFTYNVDEVASGFANELSNNKYALTYLKDSDDVVLKNLYDLMYSVNSEGEELIKNHVGRFFSTNPTIEEIKSNITGMLWSSFYKDNINTKSEEEIQKQFEEKGISKNGELVDLNADENKSALRYVLANSYFSEFKEKNNSSTLQNRAYYNFDSIFGLKDGSTKSVLVQFDDLSFGYIELIQTQKGTIISNTSGKEIYQYATFSKNFNSLNDRYKIENGGFGSEGLTKWNNINSTKFGREYFDRLIDNYKSARRNYGFEHLNNREIPQVNKMEFSGTLDKKKQQLNKLTSKEGAIKSFDEYRDSYLVEENKIPLMKNGVYVNEEGVEVNEPIYITTESQYINGQKIRNIEAKFTRPIDVNELETDMYKSVMLFKTASNAYRGLKNNESQALLLQTILEGDKSLGIDPRKAKVKKLGKDVSVPGGGVKMKEHDLNTSKMMLKAINSYVYGIDNEDYGIFGSNISAKKISGVISGYTAYTALAWNVLTIPSNMLISTVNTRIVAEGNQWFNKTDWIEAQKTYTKNIPNFLKDFGSKGFGIQKSPITQLISRFNAIQGEFLSPRGELINKNVGDKIAESAMFWNQEMAEHKNQTESMIMLMMGYKLPSGKSLWKAIQDANVNRKDGEELIMPDEFTRELEVEFQKRLQGVNRQIHGNFQSLDKNMMQKHIFLRLFMTFKRHIYDGFRSRFMEERYDQELRDEQEGYIRTYFKALNKEFSEIAKTQGLTAALKSNGAASIGKFFLKSTLGAWDAATFRLASKNENVKKYLYGEDVTERQYYAAMKATYDMGMVVRAMIFVAVAQGIMNGLDEDDEEMKWIMSYANIYAKRLEGDLGFFTSFTNFGTGYAGPTLDQTFKYMRSPLAGVRTMDNTAGLLYQLTDFDLTNAENEFEFTYHGLDKYEKSGNGYEKGDYKIFRKAQKSIISPYFQMLRLATPEDQLKYLGMTQKYQ